MVSYKKGLLIGLIRSRNWYLARWKNNYTARKDFISFHHILILHPIHTLYLQANSQSSTFNREEHLVSASALPEMSLGGNWSTVLSCGNLMLNSSVGLLVSVCRETSEQNNEGRKEEAEHSSQDGPHTSGVICVTSTSIPVHVSLDDAK